jgi:hypothetical protein
MMMLFCSGRRGEGRSFPDAALSFDARVCDVLFVGGMHLAVVVLFCQLARMSFGHTWRHRDVEVVRMFLAEEEKMLRKRVKVRPSVFLSHFFESFLRHLS